MYEGKDKSHMEFYRVLSGPPLVVGTLHFSGNGSNSSKTGVHRSGRHAQNG